jgi:hypothetical protein
LTLEEQRIYDKQKQQILEQVAMVRKHIITEYELGTFCVDIKNSGLWARDPANAGLSFVQFLCRVTGRKGSYTTFDRRIRLVVNFTIVAVLALYDAGVDFMSIVECTYGAPELRPHLLELAKLGLPLSKLMQARRAGNRKLKEAKKRLKEQKKKQQQGESIDPVAEALLAMQQALAQRQAEGEDDEHGSGEEDGLASREEDLVRREGEVVQREQKVALLMQEVEAKAAELEAQREQLQLRAELGLGEGVQMDQALEARLLEVRQAQSALGKAQEQLKEEKKKIAQWHAQAEQQAAQVKAGLAEIEAGRAEVASGRREIAQQVQEAQQVLARLGEVQERERAVVAQAERRRWRRGSRR